MLQVSDSEEKIIIKKHVKGKSNTCVKTLHCTHISRTLHVWSKEPSHRVSTASSLGLLRVIFHQLDVLDSLGIHNLADFFIAKKFGKLDILVVLLDDCIRLPRTCLSNSSQFDHLKVDFLVQQSWSFWHCASLGTCQGPWKSR
ncbi:unnamed protein product [Linum trigynum]|uniref:Uncharacterized protein n=1 Tax=Linum trigynum TaxID=586398 RepID=A0AAV2FZ24_9ROSI